MVPAGSVRPFRANGSPVAKFSTFPAAEVTTCKAFPLVLLNMMRSPGWICAPEAVIAAMFTHVGSKVTVWPFRVMEPAGQPGLAPRGGWLMGLLSNPELLSA